MKRTTKTKYRIDEKENRHRIRPPTGNLRAKRSVVSIEAYIAFHMLGGHPYYSAKQGGSPQPVPPHIRAQAIKYAHKLQGIRSGRSKYIPHQGAKEKARHAIT